MINLLNQVKAYFYVRPSLSKNKRGTFYVRVTIDGKQIVSSVKSLELYENEFDAKTQNPKPNCDLYMEVSDFMLGVKKELYRIHNDYQKKRMIFTKDDLRNAVHEVYHRLKHGQKQDALTFLEIFDMFMKEQKTKIGKMISQGTYDMRISYQVKLKATLISLKLQSLPILNFTAKECSKIQNHLVSNHNKNYVGRVMSAVNMVFKFAKKGNYIYENPCDDVDRIKIDKSPDLFWLEQDEILRILELKLEGRTKRLRDAFVFCCYTGLSIGDYELLNPKKNKQEISRSKSPKDIQPGKLISVGERTVLTGRRRKTGTLYRVPLPQEAMNILSEYGGGLEKLPFSLYSNGQVLNLIARQAGIENRIRFHTARKSFANYLLNVKKMNPYYVKDIMGWIKLEEAEPYTRVSNDTLISELA